MTDLDRLLARFETGALLRPSARVPNVVDLAHALAWRAGGDGAPLAPGAQRLADLIGDTDHLIFILADGLGLALLETLAPETFLATHVVAELRTVFPSSTPTVLTALATGAWPGAHGITGQWTHLPAIQGSADLLRFAARSGGVSLAKLGVRVEQAFPLPALMTDVRRDSLALFPEAIANSVSATFFSGQHPRRGYRALSAVIDLIIDRVHAVAAPTYTSLYAPWIDQEAHRHGLRHPGVRAAIQDLNREVERLARCVSPRTRIVISADHGLLDTPVLARHWLRPTPDFLALLRTPPSGDARVMYLHAREGARETLRRRFADRYGDRFIIITVDEAEAIELFGPGALAPATRQRLGDLIVLSAGVDVIDYVPAGSIDRVLSIASHHSGLSPAEMRVPLIVV